MEAKAVFWQAITPVHPGTGQAVDGVVDLPVAREVATGFPMIPASSFKGVLRDGRQDEASNRIFGSKEQAGKLILTDARVLLLPVRAYFGTFALITCPLVLRRFLVGQRALGLDLLKGPIPEPGPTQALLAPGSLLEHKGKVLLEDIDLEGGLEEGLAQELAGLLFAEEEERNLFLQRFALVSDQVFAYFSETGLEVIARVQLNPEKKVVEEGPWYEEAIPAETVLSQFALGEEGFSELDRPYLQVGGQASIGRGLLRRLGVRP